MAKSANEIARLSNAFSTGSGGANFERHVQAVFALTLLIDGFSPIMNIPIQRLDFQAKYLGYDVDDLVVTASKAGKEPKAIKYTLANNPASFCKLMETVYKKDMLMSLGESTIKLWQIDCLH